MRLNPREGMSAADFLEGASVESLIRAVREYGEERRWRRLLMPLLRHVELVISEPLVCRVGCHCCGWSQVEAADTSGNQNFPRY